MNNASRKIEWAEGPLKFSIIGSQHSHFCGYVTFPERPLQHSGYWEYQNIDVHGGITYAKEKNDSSYTYGFDCAHWGDENNPNTRDLDWLQNECRRMAAGIMLAALAERGRPLPPSQSELPAIIAAFLE